MVKKLFSKIILIVLLLVTIVILYPYESIDPRLAKYDNQFKEYLNKYCKSGNYFRPIQKTLRIQYAEDHVIAYCSTNFVTRMNIVYNKKYFDSNTEDGMYLTLMHEFTHCYLKVTEHTDDENHYMYAYHTYLPKEIVEQQLIETIKQVCK